MNDWKARAEREAAAVLDEAYAGALPLRREALIALMAMAWCQGAIFASHLDLSALEIGSDELRAAL